MDCKKAEELLPSYALNALSEQETVLVEAHLTTCHWCSTLLREHLQVAAVLAQAAEHSELPQGLKRRTLRAVESQRRKEQRKAGPTVAAGRWLLGATASLVVLLLAAGIGISIHMSRQIDDLRNENTELASRLAQGDENLVNMFLEQRFVSYVMASPDKQVLSLQGVRGVPEAQGVLMIAAQGDIAILMARGLEPSSGDDGYQVWLSKDGQSDVMGSLSVDQRGWGVLMLWADQPITSFQTVEVTKDMDEDSATSTDRRLVLWSTLK